MGSREEGLQEGKVGVQGGLPSTSDVTGPYIKPLSVRRLSLPFAGGGRERQVKRKSPQKRGRRAPATKEVRKDSLTSA